MLTISRIESPVRQPSLLEMAAAAVTAPAGFARVEFLWDMDPEDRNLWSRKQEARSKWLSRVLDRTLAPNSAELTKTVRPVFELLSQFGSESIDLRHLPETVNGVHLAAVLRSTADELDGTDAWRQALALAQRALLRDGLDPQDALLGMIPRG
jgi:hypothetical protein